MEVKNDHRSKYSNWKLKSVFNLLANYLGISNDIMILQE